MKPGNNGIKKKAGKKDKEERKVKINGRKWVGRYENLYSHQ